MSANRRRVNALTRDLSRIAARAVREWFGLDFDQADDLGEDIAQAAHVWFKSELVYFPLNTRAKADARGRAMLDAFLAANGDIVPVATQFGVCIQTAYRRVRLARAGDVGDDGIPALTRDLADVAARAIKRRLGVDADSADEAGLCIAQELCNKYQGQQLYFLSLEPEQGQLFGSELASE